MSGHLKMNFYSTVMYTSNAHALTSNCLQHFHNMVCGDEGVKTRSLQYQNEVTPTCHEYRHLPTNSLTSPIMSVIHLSLHMPRDNVTMLMRQC